MAIGLLEKAQKKRNEMLLEAIVGRVSSMLAGFCGGMPLDTANGEKEAAVMLAPGKKDTAIYLVALDERGAIVRVAAKYSGAELAAQLTGKLKTAGVDLDAVMAGQAGVVEPLNGLDDERIG